MNASATTGGNSGGAFNPRVLLAIIVAGIVGFLGYAVLSAFAPQLSSGNNGGNHALSKSAVGYAGVAEMLRAAGHPVSIVRDPRMGVRAPGGGNATGGLLVLTPTMATTAAEVQERLEGIDVPVLIVLPGYVTKADPKHRGWVRRVDATPYPALSVQSPDEDIGVDARPAPPAIQVKLWDRRPFSMPTPRFIQTVSGGGIEPLIGTEDAILLGVLPNRANTYVLTDPDFLNNLAMASDARATAAVRLLTTLVDPGQPIAFDVTLNGLGSDANSLLRLAFTPPFLGLTLCLIVAALLALWQGFVRFGPPFRDEGANALGKGGLVANAAQLIVLARRVPAFGGRYSAMTRDMAAQRLHAPARLAGDDIDRWLDRFTDSRGQKFSALAHRLDGATTTEDCVADAAALAQWRKDILREHD